MKYLILVLLVSCSSIGDIREKTPLINKQSNKSIDEYSSCIGEKWSKHDFSISTLKIKNGSSISLRQDLAGTFSVVDIISDGDKSKVTYYESSRVLFGYLKDEVESCL